MGMREEFEAWIVSLDVGYDIRFMEFIGGLGDGEFFDAEVQGLWTCWQASRATPKPKVCECPSGVRNITDGGHFPACTTCKRRIAK
jgi:hypothetical protein